MNYIKSLQEKIENLEVENAELKRTGEHIHNPEKNPKAVSIIQQEDGNWKGFMNKNGKVVEARDYDPQMVLQALLTHE